MHLWNCKPIHGAHPDGHLYFSTGGTVLIGSTLLVSPKLLGIGRNLESLAVLWYSIVDPLGSR